MVVSDYKVGLLDKWTFNNISGASSVPVNSDGGALGLAGTIHPEGELDVKDTQGGGNKGLEFFNNTDSVPDRIDLEHLYVNGVEAASRASQWTGIANADDDLNIGFAKGPMPHGTAFRGVMDEVRIYDTALDATTIASSFTTGPEVPNPINLQAVYFEDFESGYSNGDPVTNKAEWTVGNATVVDSPGVLGGGTAAGLPDGHGLVLGGFVDTTENKVSFGEVTAEKVYFSSTCTRRSITSAA